MIDRQTTDPGLIAFYQLIVLALFFAMRSCEYLKVSGDRRTTTLCLRDIVFRTENEIVHHSSPDLHLADRVTLTFQFQKNQNRKDSVTQSKSGHPACCPVHAAAAIVKRLRTNDFCPDNTPLYRYYDANGRSRDLTSTVALKFLRSFVATVHPVFGLTPKTIGLHSIRSSAAMAMYLNKIQPRTIMLIGRWSSEAIFVYIRRSVAELSNNVSALMLENPTYHSIDPPNYHALTNDTPLPASDKHQVVGSNGATICWKSSSSVFD
jgi:hypothetical protein